jgi:hypothetical protein
MVLSNTMRTECYESEKSLGRSILHIALDENVFRQFVFLIT